jgi:putative ABC transport system permease protein
MFKNYLKIAWRNLGKSKVSAFINIGGLAIGMAVAMLIGLWIWDELSFDKYHKNYNRIAQVMQNQVFNGEIETRGSQAMQLAPELRAGYGSYFKYVVTSSGKEEHLLSVGEKKLTQGGQFMEPVAPEMLTLKMLKGTRAGLRDLNSIMLAESVAKAFFRNAEPVGKVIKIDNKQDVKITGVYEDLPHNCTFAGTDFIAPWALKVKNDRLEQRVGWGNNWFQTYVQLAEHVNMTSVSEAIKYAKFNRINDDEGKRFKPELFLHPMSRWHLYSDFKNGASVGGSVQYVWLFGITGAFVLLLACINFMNLSTARSEKRAKEVGIRKAIGSLRGQLIKQFYGESLLVVVIAFVLSLILVQLFLPFFNEVANKKMTILWGDPSFWTLCLGFSILTGLIAGSYPALYLSSFRPVKVLKGTFRAGRLAAIPRKTLVVIQFAVSVTLIIGTIVVFRQIQFARNRPIGYNNNGLITVPIKTDEIIKHYDAFRNELLQTGAVKELAATDVPVTATFVTNSGFDWKGKDPAMGDEFLTVRITHEFGKTVDWEIKEGRDFSKSFAGDSLGFIVNESAVKYMGLKNPVGETIKWGNDDKYTIIGVIKDLVTQSPYTPVKQTIFFINYKRIRLVNIKISPQAGAGEALAKIETVYKKFDPVNLFEYKFADQEYAKKFSIEERIGKLAAFFAILAILISCLGLFGLSSFVAEQRTKEIGVRKVLGASIFTVWRLMSKEFVLLVIISLFIAVPTAYYFMHNWLQNYAYRAAISWWIFAAAGTGALIITLITVSFQSVKAALMNPARALRSE